MKISVQFPLHTRSENVNRRFGNPYARAHSTARERQDVRMFLDSQLPKLRTRLSTGPNFYRVTMVRIGAGLLDDDGVPGALKAVRDEVADWLGIKDGPNDPASWRVAQQKCPPKFYGVRVEIEDDDPDPREVIRVCGPTIPHMGPVIGDCSHCGRPTRSALDDLSPHLRANPGDRMHAPAPPMSESERRAWTDRLNGRLVAHRSVQRQEQTALVFRRAFYALPEEQGEDVVLHELVNLGDNPPKVLRVKRSGERIELSRRLSKDFPELGECWIYEVAGELAGIVATQEKEAIG